MDATNHIRYLGFVWTFKGRFWFSRQDVDLEVEKMYVQSSVNLFECRTVLGLWDSAVAAFSLEFGSLWLWVPCARWCCLANHRAGVQVTEQKRVPMLLLEYRSRGWWCRGKVSFTEHVTLFCKSHVLSASFMFQRWIVLVLKLLWDFVTEVKVTSDWVCPKWS